MARPRRQIEHTGWFIILFIQVNRSVAVKHFDACKNFQQSFPSFPCFSPTLFFVTDIPAQPALPLVLKIGKTTGQPLAQTGF